MRRSDETARFPFHVSSPFYNVHRTHPLHVINLHSCYGPRLICPARKPSIMELVYISGLRADSLRVLRVAIPTLVIARSLRGGFVELLGSSGGLSFASKIAIYRTTHSEPPRHKGTRRGTQQERLTRNARTLTRDFGLVSCIFVDVKNELELGCLYRRYTLIPEKARDR